LLGYWIKNAFLKLSVEELNTVSETFFNTLYTFRKPGILWRILSHRATSFRPIKLETITPVMSITANTNIIPDPGKSVFKLNNVSGRYFVGTSLFINSRKNLMTTTLRARGTQKRRPEIK